MCSLTLCLPSAVDIHWQVIRALMDLCRVGTTSVRKRCVAAIWNMTNVEQVAHSGGSAAESIPMLLVRGKDGESSVSGWVQEEEYDIV